MSQLQTVECTDEGRSRGVMVASRAVCTPPGAPLGRHFSQNIVTEETSDGEKLHICLDNIPHALKIRL